MNNTKIDRCPKCGYPDVYTGIWAIECGYIKSCPNWTKAQSDEVERLNAVRYPEPECTKSTESETHTGPFQFSLDYGDDDDTPTWITPDFEATD